MKAATKSSDASSARKAISIHAAREGGDSSGMSFPNKCNISIHAAREGGDYNVIPSFPTYIISIHAAREGGDTEFGKTTAARSNFNPRRP